METDTRATTALNKTILPPPPLHEEETPPLPLSPQVPPLPEINEILTNMVNLLRQQGERLECDTLNPKNIYYYYSFEIRV
jgi:hypothetical protein